MEKRFSEYTELAEIEMVSRRTFEKTAAAYAISNEPGKEMIVADANNFILANESATDVRKQAIADGYRDFLKSIERN